MRIFDETEIGYVREVLNSGRLGWYRGGMTGRFEKAFAEFTGAKHAISRNSKQRVALKRDGILKSFVTQWCILVASLL